MILFPFLDTYKTKERDMIIASTLSFKRDIIYSCVCVLLLLLLLLLPQQVQVLGERHGPFLSQEHGGKEGSRGMQIGNTKDVVLSSAAGKPASVRGHGRGSRGSQRIREKESTKGMM